MVFAFCLFQQAYSFFNISSHAYATSIWTTLCLRRLTSQVTKFSWPEMHESCSQAQTTTSQAAHQIKAPHLHCSRPISAAIRSPCFSVYALIRRSSPHCNCLLGGWAWCLSLYRRATVAPTLISWSCRSSTPMSGPDEIGRAELLLKTR